MLSGCGSSFSWSLKDARIQSMCCGLTLPLVWFTQFAVLLCAFNLSRVTQFLDLITFFLFVFVYKDCLEYLFPSRCLNEQNIIITDIYWAACNRLASAPYVINKYANVCQHLSFTSWPYWLFFIYHLVTN